MYTEEEVQQMQSKIRREKKQENQKLRKRIEALQKQFNNTLHNQEKELVYGECEMLLKQKGQMEEVTNKLNENLSALDTSIKSQLEMNKSLKASIDTLNTNRTVTLKAIDEMESRIRDTEQKTECISRDVTAAISKSKTELNKVDINSKSLLNNLQTQLKVLETKKRSLESNLEQKREETKELTKICEDLISPHSDKK